MPQQFLTFQFWAHVVFALLGAGLFYMQWGRDKLRAYAFSDLFDMFEIDENVRARWEFAIFVLIGTVVAMGVAKPINVQQAFSAGLGWTGVASKPGPIRRAKPKGGV
jgi:hypothetical protein